MTRLDEYSVSSLKLKLFCNDQNIGSATGFFWRFQRTLYLVSNWHVFSGRNPLDGQPRHAAGAVPDQVRLPIHDARQLGFARGVRLNLLSDDGRPRWLQHPVKGQDIDVAILQVSLPPELVAYELPRPNEPADMAVQIGMDVFILGFPLGIARQGPIPIWKRGTIASEPEFEIDDLPVFLIDSATREGMSGSPVVLRSFGGFLAEDGSSAMGPGAFTKFLGVYSGRYVSRIEEEAQIGRVWKASVLPEIANGNTIGDHEIR